MTAIDLFLDRLAQTARDWEVSCDSIRVIRGPRQECPISAVTQGGSRAFIDPISYATQAGLTKADARRVRNAADDLHQTQYIEGSAEEHRELRDRLLVACGLRKGL